MGSRHCGRRSSRRESRRNAPSKLCTWPEPASALTAYAACGNCLSQESLRRDLSLPHPLVCKAIVYIFIECSSSNWSRQALEEHEALEGSRAPAK